MQEQQANQQLAELLERINKLPDENLEPPQFFAHFLQLTIAATGSRGGAIWVIQRGQPPQCYCHVELELSRIDDETQQRSILEAMERSCKEERTMVLPAGGMVDSPDNQCDYPLFFKPLKTAGTVAMVLQLIASETLPPDNYRHIAGLLNQIGESAEKYLTQRRAVVLDDDRKALARLLQFTEGVHSSLDAEKVIYQLANLGRDALGCNRAVVWVDPKIKRGLRAVSGIDKPDQRAVLMQAIIQLSKYCLTIKKPIVASRDQLVELPEEDELTDLLKNYFNVSKLDRIMLEPMCIGNEYLGVFIAEGFDNQSVSNMTGIINTIAKHGALALNNALEMQSVPMFKPLARIKGLAHNRKKRRKWTIWVIVILIALTAMAMTPWPVKIGADCELTPREKFEVQSPLDNVRIIKVLHPTGQVKKGQIVMQLDDLDLQTDLAGLEFELRKENINRDKALTETDRKNSQLQMERLQNQIAFKKKQIEMCKVRAPVSGTILTPELELKQGLTVKKGEKLFEIANLHNWMLKLDVPQEDINWLQKGLKENKLCKVYFFLKAFPEYKLETQLSNVNQISEMARTKKNGNVFEVRIEVPAKQLAVLGHGLRSGMLGRAKIVTTNRPLGYVLLRKVIRFFRVAFF